MNNNPKPYIIAITGSFGTGKSLVGEILKEFGMYVIDTDDIVRDILKSKNQVTLKIVKEFGDEVINKNSESFINKSSLSSIVFNDAKKRKTLETIIHPEVRGILANLISFNKDKNIIVVLVPLLFESHLENLYNETWCVMCDEKMQLERLQEKGYSLGEASSRIKAQLSQGEKAKQSDFVLDNSSTKDKTKEQVIERLKQLAQLNHNLHVSFYK